MLNLQQLHEKILYPVVRVKTDSAGGSGTVIYSKPNPDKPDEYQTFVLTCSHVVDGAISYKKDWDSLLQKEIKKEILDEITVEVFKYVNLSTKDTSDSFRANIVAYDKTHDIAVVKLDSPTKIEYVASLVPRDKIRDVKIFTPIYAAGCSLLHDPIQNSGQITYLVETIETKRYYMNNADQIFGNSGGAVFLADTGDQIGITARVTSMQLGFGVDIMTWMNFCVCPDRIYEFFDEQELRFLYDGKDTYDKAMARRKRKAEQARLLRKTSEEMEIGEDDQEP